MYLFNDNPATGATLKRVQFFRGKSSFHGNNNTRN